MNFRLSRRTFLHTAAAGASVLTFPTLSRARQYTAADRRRFDTVRQFADNVLEAGRDHYGSKPTPLLVDGVNVDTREPVRWLHRGQAWVCSNLASQQNLFRTLAGLSQLTGDNRYRQAAVGATHFHFENLVRSCGLLQWGGHRFYDAATGNFVGEQDTHELKASYPFYEFLWQVNPTATERFIKAFWNAHIMDWAELDMNRHGRYGLTPGNLWNHEFKDGPAFFAGRGLTFINTGSDLFYAGALLHSFTGDQGALTWATRLLGRYVAARDPKTKLGAYQYSQLAAGRDRAKVQFGPEFGDLALEGKVLDPGRATTIYGRASICQMRMAELGGKAGRPFLDWTREGLLAYARHAYDPKTNQVRALFTDGTPLRPEHVVRPGYYSAGTFEPGRASTLLLFSYAMAYRYTRDPELWPTLRAMARAQGLGDLGRAAGQSVQTNPEATTADAHSLFALLEIIKVAPDAAYLELARRVADNLIRARFHKGFFLPSASHLHANFDEIEPLALLTLEALLRNEPEAVPLYPAGRGYIHGPHDGLGRTYDSAAIWSKRRGK